MGIQQSREDTESTLRLLRQSKYKSNQCPTLIYFRCIVSAEVFQVAKAKLEDLSRNKCKMNVTKFELLLIFQMNARDIKYIG